MSSVESYVGPGFAGAWVVGAAWGEDSPAWPQTEAQEMTGAPDAPEGR